MLNGITIHSGDLPQLDSWLFKTIPKRQKKGFKPGVASIICGDKVGTGYLYGVLPLNAPFTVPQIKLPKCTRIFGENWLK